MPNLLKDLNDLISSINSFVHTSGDRIIADLNTYIASVEADPSVDAAGKAQQEAGPKDLVVLIQMIEQAIGPLPDGANALFIILKLAQKVQNPAALSEFNNQAKKVLGDFGAVAKLFPGLPL